jgi:sialate O-acetylesterase
MKKLTSCLGVLLLNAMAHGGVVVSKVFTPHMVLQRGMDVPIYGTADPGEKVEVKFRTQSKAVLADKEGRWLVKLESLEAGGPDVLTIGEREIGDVLVGDVWIGSGQSNMQMPVSAYVGGDPVLAAACKETYPKIRLMTQGAKDVWKEATPENIAGFSALCFSFGFQLQKEENVPIGLMVGAVGGTPSGFWLSEEMFRNDAACQEVVSKFATSGEYEAMVKNFKDTQAKYEQEHAAWLPLAEAAKKEGKTPPPGPSQPRKPPGKPGEAGSGKIGQLFEANIRPYVGYGIKGVLWDQGESRTNIVGVDQVTLMGALISGWRKEWGQGNFPFLYVQKPSGGGCAFDDSQPMNRLAEKFSPLPGAIPGVPGASYSHEVFVRIMKYPNTHMVTSSDLGQGIHPPNKSGYGARAVQVALGTAYGRKNEYLGPLYAGHKIDGDKVILNFTHTGKGLTFKNGEALQGFMIAGEDRKFAWADAKVKGGTVVVSSGKVPRPVAVRYAWSGRFTWANLFNQDGLPAQPFRTDSW